MRKRLLSLALALVMALAVVPVTASAAFTERTSAPAKDSKYYYDKSYNPFEVGQCTWYAWGRAYEITGTRPTWSTRGNADVWHTNAKNAGYTVGSTPKVGSIACWGSTWNHVAVVERIDANGNRVCSEFNRNSSKAFKTETMTTKTNSNWAGNNYKVYGLPKYYIYLLDDAGGESHTPTKTVITFDLVTPSSFTVGTDIALDGSMSATGSKINSVKVEIVNDANGSVVLSASSSGNFSVETYGPLVAKNSKLNSDLDLGKLSVGTYYARYTVGTQDGTTASKETGRFNVNPVSCNENHTRGGYLGAADTHPHWVYWRCAICGERYTEWGVETKASCEICNPPEPEKPDCSNGHTWGEWDTVREADCELNGKRQRFCSVCGEWDSQPIAATGHNWGRWDIVEEASCEQEGRKERVCQNCGEKETETIAALEHDYRVDGETDEAVYYVCANCGDNYTEGKKPSETGKGDFQNFTTQNRYTNGSFGDVKSGDWFYENVKTTYELGLMKGTGSGTFSPGNNVTLAEAITLAARIHSIYYTGSDSFASYDGGNWYDPYVDYARENNIINTYYNYSRPATREEFVHILAKALPEEALENIAGRISFADSGDITYMAEVQLLSGAGIINGIKENGQLYFKPLNTITRAEVAAVVARMAKPSQRVGN